MEAAAAEKKPCAHLSLRVVLFPVLFFSPLTDNLSLFIRAITAQTGSSWLSLSSHHTCGLICCKADERRRTETWLRLLCVGLLVMCAFCAAAFSSSLFLSRSLCCSLPLCRHCCPLYLLLLPLFSLFASSRRKPSKQRLCGLSAEVVRRQGGQRSNTNKHGWR